VIESIQASSGVDRPTQPTAHGAADTHAGIILDRLASLAALSQGTALGALGILEADQIRFKARVGLGVVTVPLQDARFLTGKALTTIPDTLLDPDIAHSPLVQASPYIRFYAGAPVIMSDGTHIGMLCAMDTVPHPPPNAYQRASLGELAALAAAELERQGQPPAYATPPDPDQPTKAPEGAHHSLLAAYVAKSEFLASLSHELRTPLNAILGYADLIAASSESTGFTFEHAGEIKSAARHMLALVNDILEYSRLEAGTVSIGWQRVALRTIVEEALRMVRVFATSRGVKLACELSWPGAMVRGDPVRLKQVLLNLLTNGIKFTPRESTVTVSLARSPEGLVELAVHDNGIGIAEEDIPKTLTPFGQIVPKDGVPIEGTGLGLPIAKALVERLGGRLTLESTLGEGTIVRVLLPALAQSAGLPDRGVPPVSPPLT
jgi:signal transduction histidine kinase